MKKYGIIKETKEKTKTVRYFIEKYHKFLWWHWWKKIEEYEPLCMGMTFIASWRTLKEVKKQYDLLTEKTITEIIKY